MLADCQFWSEIQSRSSARPRQDRAKMPPSARCNRDRGRGLEIKTSLEYQRSLPVSLWNPWTVTCAEMTSWHVVFVIFDWTIPLNKPMRSVPLLVVSPSPSAQSRFSRLHRRLPAWGRENLALGLPALIEMLMALVFRARKVCEFGVSAADMGTGLPDRDGKHPTKTSVRKIPELADANLT